MSVKMRVNKDLEAKCSECGRVKKNVLDMFDLKICGERFTICDICNGELFEKSLSAKCHVNGRLKYPKDIAIINARARGERNGRLKG